LAALLDGPAHGWLQLTAAELAAHPSDVPHGAAAAARAGPATLAMPVAVVHGVQEPAPTTLPRRRSRTVDFAEAAETFALLATATRVPCCGYSFAHGDYNVTTLAAAVGATVPP